jgi:hypothetical protein
VQRLADVFHVSRTGLALARSGGVLTCLSLPATGALAAPAPG